MHRLAKMGLFAATAILLAAPGSVAFADPDEGGPRWGAVDPSCWYYITNESTQAWHYDILDDQEYSIEGGVIPPGIDTNYDFYQPERHTKAERVQVWVESRPAATDTAAGGSGINFDGTFWIEVEDPDTCDAVISGSVVDESGRTRVTISGGNLTLID